MFERASVPSATSAVVAFVSVSSFKASLWARRYAWISLWRQPCLRFLWSVGAPAAVADFELALASSAPTVAADGPAENTKNPVATINTERPLASNLIWQSPHLPSSAARRDLRACRQRGRKRESSDESGRKRGIRQVGCDNPLDNTLEQSDRVSAGSISVKSLAMKPFVAIPDPICRSRVGSIIYHEFVIERRRRNKLKKRPK